MERLDVQVAFGLRSFSLELELNLGAETVALVGPSGAGKTTVLRAIAGLRRPDRGRISLGDHDWFDSDAGIDLPPERRSVGLVFQEYALFPHMTVGANVAFGGARRGAELLERFGIAALADEKPTALSGGERQRVALARALARDPKVLLLDEPLAALDAHTRGVVRGELHDLLAQLGLPTLLVTHDFRDAAGLADKIGVIVDGGLRQLGTAQQLIDDPADAFVVSLTGGNLLPGTARALAGGGSEISLDAGGMVRSEATAAGRVQVAVYPWEVSVHPVGESSGGAVNTIVGAITATTPEEGRLRVRIGAVTAESSREELDRLGLGRDAPARACFSAASTRLLSLNAE
ncbi:MAG: ABC transporter ATP-binding protein [Solirubrobacteraceae bacterium]